MAACIPCPAGTYSNETGSTTADDCSTCTQSYYSQGGATACIHCDYHTDGKSCNAPSSNINGSHLSLIIGSVVGSVVFVAASTIAIIIIYRRRKRGYQLILSDPTQLDTVPNKPENKRSYFILLIL